jgi:hypothetical protein
MRSEPRTVSEAQWVELVASRLAAGRPLGDSVQVRTGLKLSYGHEIVSYGQRHDTKTISFQTDLAIVEDLADGLWRPRVVVEAKVGKVTTHDAITYSQKASAHRAVHPYLRYGIMLGDRQHYPLPGRLYRHGAQFDFMISFRAHEPAAEELGALIDILRSEIEASRTLERLLYDSRRHDRDRYTVLHRKLVVQ